MQKRMFKAFTLLELIVVVIVLGILALVAVPAFSGVINNSTGSVVENTAKAVARDANALAAFNSGAGANLTSDANIVDAIEELSVGLDTAGGVDSDGWSKNTSTKSVTLDKNGQPTTFYICEVADRAVVQTGTC
jgi:prepilin-type N-terminal cleavage/methylation domain-containing protein